MAYIIFIGVVFGFYVGPVRTDQIIILALGCISIIKALHCRYPITVRELVVLLSLILFIVIGLFSLLFSWSDRPVLLIISQIENYVALIMIYSIWLFYFKVQGVDTLIKTQKSLIGSMCLVTILSLLMWRFGPQIASIFHIAVIDEGRPDLKGVSLLELTQLSGRYSGTFGQVFEAGTAYFLTLLSLLSLRTFYRSRFVWTVFFIFFMILGLSEIKLFWQFNRLISNLTLSNIFDIYTSHRFAEGSSIVSGIKHIFDVSPIIGLGFGYIGNSDFSLYEVMAISGIVGIVIYFLMLLLMYFDSNSVSEIFPTILILFFIFTISISAPAVTANKIGFLILITFLSLKRIWREI